jgi:ribonuclease-3
LNDLPRPQKVPPAELVAALEARLQVELSDKAMALVALTHRSYRHEHKDECPSDNERLEFLGDAVVDLAVTDRLMARFPQAPEGELTRLRALIVNEEGLATVSRRLQLGELLLLGRGEELSGGRDKSSVLADAFEAVIGAVYLCNGMPVVLAFVDRAFSEVLDGVAAGRGKDYKSMLQVDAHLRLKAVPRYRVVSETGPEHQKIFEVEVSIGAEIFARSIGRSKKEAEQSAAQKTLEQLASRPLVSPATP